MGPPGVSAAVERWLRASAISVAPCIIHDYLGKIQAISSFNFLSPPRPTPFRFIFHRQLASCL
jgi:hypothetical protein